MRIYTMTATFGKLEHETLTLNPGLNIIEAPNEWGKSTWCAFLVTMLYGLDTRAKTTKTTLADKERFAPWSGSPMSGRIELNWNGQDITIERWTKGRTLLGEFRAYETATGAAVPELTGSNCGQQLLGVEKSVFIRAGFLKLADLPVTQDESLRRRLNALVTTGDESGAGDVLAQKLKDLKNRCRHNRTGLLPQAEGELAALEEKHAELLSLQTQSEKLHTRQAEVIQRLAQLRNHQDALRYAAAAQDAQRVIQAQEAADLAQRRLEEAENRCQGLPSRDTAEQAIRTIRDIHQQAQSLQMESQMLPQRPEPPAAPAPFQGMMPAQAAAQVEQDQQTLAALQRNAKKPVPVFLILLCTALAAGAALALAKLYWAAIAAGIGLLLLGAVWQMALSNRRATAQGAIQGLSQRYGTADVAQWQAMARRYHADTERYQQRLVEYQAARGDLDQRAAALQGQLNTISDGGTLTEALNRWNQVTAAWDSLANARRDLQRSRSHAADLAAMAKPVQPPKEADHLTYTESETARILSDVVQEQQELHRRLGQCQGRMEALGQESQLNTQITALKTRVARLEDTYAALEYAQAALADAAAELQRRFAPKIAARAQALFAQLTDGRYDRFTLSEDLSVNAGAQGEDTLRTAQWRSDGTMDQLYLALRLAVAEELTPQAPLILDDALVRFDDQRLRTALQILQSQAESKQVILFTCQSRENQL